MEGALTNSGLVAGGLFLGPYLHENISIVSAAVLIAGHQLSFRIALVSLYAGMTTSDLALYGLGALARRSQYVRRKLAGRYHERLNSPLQRNMALAVVCARLIPGMIFPSYVACGWLGLSFRRFFVFCLASAAIYLPVALALALAFGETATRYFGYWAWAGLILPLMLAGFLGGQLLARKPSQDVDRIGAEACANDAAVDRANGMSIPAVHAPVLPGSRRPYSRFEFWPAYVFYAPACLYLIWQALRHGSLMLPALADPAMENGGLWGESKRRLLDDMDENSRRWLPAYVGLVRGVSGNAAADTAKVMALCNSAGIEFPLVAKPDIGCRGNGVQIISNGGQLGSYVEAFPPGGGMMFQQLVAKPGEAGIFYVRHPDEEHGRITSMTLKFAPKVVGDGTSTIEELIRADPRASRIAGVYLSRLGNESARIPAMGEEVRLTFVGNHCKGSIFRDGGGLVTPALTRWIDQIARGIPDFYFGRFDLRFSSFAELQAAENLVLIEYNGGGSEATHIWDADMTLLRAYRDLFFQIRSMFMIGAANRRRGFRAARWDRILLALWRQFRLMRRYPTNQ